VRHWDSYITPNRQSIWHGYLQKQSSSTYKLSTVQNVLNGTGLESPVPPFGGTGDFDIHGDLVAFVAKDPTLNPAFHTKSNVYVANLTGKNPPSKCVQVHVASINGTSVSPSFSADGKSVAFLQMRQDGYEADKYQIFVIPDVNRPEWTVGLYTNADNSGNWSLSPSSVKISNDGKSLYLLAESEGRVGLYSAPAEVLTKSDLPTEIIRQGSISGESC